MSGGPDSMALLLLAAATLPGRIMAATVDHRLRPESGAEGRAVGHHCARLGIPHAVLPVTLGRGSVQAAARRARYAALLEWARASGAKAMATAHHADDQAETLLLRLNRGSGVAGLAGVRPVVQLAGAELPVLRPLLGWRKRVLEDLCEQCGVVTVPDPANSDPRHDRTAARALLRREPWFDVAALARSAGHLAEAEEALAAVEEDCWQKHVRHDGGQLHYRPSGPRLIRLRILQRIIAALGTPARGSAAAALLARLERGGKGNLGGVEVAAHAGEWIARPERPRSG
ncbi:tRNA lysidine(34) synthetase TilS [Erythrobacteraceae bacterium CFH 75059]|nr:tRNA lysidine(34) synthetase TilS [Erythrobacteraceae bacterium CFH 75059]